MSSSTLPADRNDPSVGAFLSFLADDLERHQRCEVLDPALVQRAKALVQDAEVNLSELLPVADD